MKIKISTNILDYFYMMMDLDNESERDIIIDEFKKELTKSLNVSGKIKEIEWIKN